LQKQTCADEKDERECNFGDNQRTTYTGSFNAAADRAARVRFEGLI
jgi:hypothetical protein